MAQAVNGVAAGAGAGIDLDFKTQVIGGTLLFGGAPIALKAAKGLVWDMPKWTCKNFGNYRKGFGEILTNYKASRDAIQSEINLLRGNNFFQTANNRAIWKELNSRIPSANATSIGEMLEKSFSKERYFKLRKENPAKAAEYLKKFQDRKAIKQLKADCYKEAKAKIAEIKRGNLTPKEIKVKLKEVDRLISQGDAKVQELIKSGDIKPTSKLGRMGAKLKKYTGLNAMNNAIARGTQSSSATVRGLSKGAKCFVKSGGALTTAIEFAIETPTIIKTFKQQGAKSGFKQMGKSATVAAASGIGFAVGTKVGAIAGAKIGVGIGTFIGGPVGTFIGGTVGSLLGMAAGLAGSYFASQGAKKLVGKSEIDKANTQKALAQCKEAGESPEKLEELVKAYTETISKRENLVAESMTESAHEKLDVAA